MFYLASNEQYFPDTNASGVKSARRPSAGMSALPHFPLMSATSQICRSDPYLHPVHAVRRGIHCGSWIQICSSVKFRVLWTQTSLFTQWFHPQWNRPMGKFYHCWRKRGWQVVVTLHLQEAGLFSCDICEYFFKNPSFTFHINSSFWLLLSILLKGLPKLSYHHESYGKKDTLFMAFFSFGTSNAALQL